MTSTGKKHTPTAVNSYFIKNSKGEGKRKKLLPQAVGTGLGGVLGVYKVGLK